MRSFEEIMDNPNVRTTACKSGVLLGFVILQKSGKPLDYSLIIDDNKVGRIEHASINCLVHNHLPTWEELCELKDIVWFDEEECYQVFPKKSQYVNFAKNCMHIWRNK